jgi:hypothetical protein
MDSFAALVCAIVVIALAFVVVACGPISKRRHQPEGFVPMRDDAMAARYCPVFKQQERFGDIAAIYYHAAVDLETELVYIACHTVWERDVNTSATFGGWLGAQLLQGRPLAPALHLRPPATSRPCAS